MKENYQTEFKLHSQPLDFMHHFPPAENKFGNSYIIMNKSFILFSIFCGCSYFLDCIAD
jgi:hypothetical protein